MIEDSSFSVTHSNDVNFLLECQNSKISRDSRCESDEWKLEHDYCDSCSVDLNHIIYTKSGYQTLPVDQFMIKHKYLLLLPTKNNALLVVRTFCLFEPMRNKRSIITTYSLHRYRRRI